MRKYTGTEKVEVVSPEQVRALEGQLQKHGKSRVADLTDEEREESLRIALDSDG